MGIEHANAPRWLTMVLGCLTATVLAPAAACAEASTRPNVVLVVSDDHGYPDYGFMGSETARTPHIDRLASEGVVFTRGYTYPVCAPSLATLLTGRHPHTSGITGNDLEYKSRRPDLETRDELAVRLLENDPLLPRALARAGYRTFQAGKLWNNGYAELGFGEGMTKERSRTGGPGLDIGRKGLQPIREFLQASAGNEAPFFIWYAPYLPHRPHFPPERMLEAHDSIQLEALRRYHAMISWLDETVGELDAMLDEFGVREDTLVLYLADNGWAVDVSQRGGVDLRSKDSGYELGIRTPLIVRWPSHTTPSIDRTTPVSVLDVVPTILAAAGIEAPADLEGLDLLGDALARREAIHLAVFTSSIRELNRPSRSLRARIAIEGRWKLLVPGPRSADTDAADPSGIELYDLASDPLESSNLEARERATVRRLHKRLDEWWDGESP